MVPDELMGGAGGVGDEAGHLLPGQRRRAPGEGAGPGIAAPAGSMPAKSMLPAARRGGVPVFRRPILKPRSLRQAARPVAANSPARPAGMRQSADVDEAVQKGAGGDEHGPGPVGQPQGFHHPHHPAVLHQEPLHHGLSEIDPALFFQVGFHGQAIGLFVALDAGAPDRRPFGEVEGAELDAGLDPPGSPHPRPGRRSPSPSGPWPGRPPPGCRPSGPWCPD